MTPQVRRWLEKLQVQVAAVAAVALAWFVGWPMVRPWDPQSALAFAPTGQIVELATFAGIVWVLAAACALLTLSARIEGALLAALAGAAGLALRSGPMETLLQTSAGHLRKTFIQLAAETVAMAAILVGALLVITLVRALAGRAARGWAWSERPAGGEGDKPRRFGSGAANLLGCLVVELAVAIMALALTFRSPETGQIAFALAGSFFAAALVAHQTFPVRSTAPFWVAPLIMGAAVLALGGVVVEGAGPGWYQALMVAQGRPMRAALPVHWLGLGCGGAIAGLWFSHRLRDRDETSAKRPAPGA